MHIKTPQFRYTDIKLKYHETECLHEKIINEFDEENDKCITIIEIVNTYKYLGVYVDQNFKWNVHIEELRKKLRKAAYMLYQLRNCSNNAVLRQAYFSLVESHIRHGITAWGNSSYCRLLQTTQDRLIKIICKNRNSYIAFYNNENFNRYPNNETNNNTTGNNTNNIVPNNNITDENTTNNVRVNSNNFTTNFSATNNNVVINAAIYNNAINTTNNNTNNNIISNTTTNNNILNNSITTENNEDITEVLSSFTSNNFATSNNHSNNRNTPDNNTTCNNTFHNNIFSNNTNNNSNDQTPYNNIAKKENILNIQGIFYTTMAIEFYNDTRYLNKINHRHNTRYKAEGKYNVQKHKNNYGKSSLPVLLPTIFNLIPQEIINTTNNNRRKKLIKNFFISLQ